MASCKRPALSPPYQAVKEPMHTFKSMAAVHEKPVKNATPRASEGPS